MSQFKSVKIAETIFEPGLVRIIVPLSGSDLAGVLSEIKVLKAHPDYKSIDLIEWRIDYFTALISPTKHSILSQDFIEAAQAIKTELDKPLLVTLRTKIEGGEFNLDTDYYAQILKAVLKLNIADAIDFEAFKDFNTLKELFELAKGTGVSTIASYHNFNSTPDECEIIEKILYMSNDLGADIPKIALMPRSFEDVLTLMQATYSALQQLKSPIIAISMGEIGKVSRICGASFGSCATFAIASSASAPGQIPLKELNQMLKSMEIKDPNN